MKDDLSYLKSLGKLSKDFNIQPLIKFLQKDNIQVRYYALKNIAKLNFDHYLNDILLIIYHDPSSLVRREAVSCLGRAGNIEYAPLLLSLLNDKDPNIILQATRGLLKFKKLYHKEIEHLKNHPNEVVSSYVLSELRQIKKENNNYNLTKNVLIEGNSLDILKLMPNDSIHLTFTSPPYYNAKDYSIYKSYEEYLDTISLIFNEVLRLTKEGRFLIVNTSPVIVPRISRNHSSKRYAIPFDLNTRLTSQGWEFIDDIIWLKPEACVKNRNGGFQQHKNPLAYKPNIRTEYIFVYRKKTDKLIDWNLKQYSSDIINKSKILDKFESSNIWAIDPARSKDHPAIFPTTLCEKVIKYYSLFGDTILDPFAGSGTVGKTCQQLDRKFILTEICEEYCESILKNIQNIMFTNYDNFRNDINEFFSEQE